MYLGVHILLFSLLNLKCSEINAIVPGEIHPGNKSKYFFDYLQSFISFKLYVRNCTYKTHIDSRFTSLGCWEDKTDRAIPSLEGIDTHQILRHTVNYKRRKAAIQKCFELARSLGFSVFAIQNGGQCLGSSTAQDTYRKYGESSKCKKDGKGGPLANQVYEIKKGQR